MKRNMFWILIIILFLLSGDAEATTYFVRDVDSCGSACSDSRAGTDRDSAWVSLNKAFATVSAGDTVFVGSGDYNSADKVDTLDQAWNTYVYFIGDLDGDTCGEVGWPKIGKMWGINWGVRADVWFQNLYFDTYGTDPKYSWLNMSFTYGVNVTARLICDGCRFAGGVTSMTADWTVFRNCYFEDDPAITGVRGFYALVRVGAVDTVIIDNNTFEFNNDAHAGVLDFCLWLDLNNANNDSCWVRNNLFVNHLGGDDAYIGHTRVGEDFIELDYNVYDDDIGTGDIGCRKPVGSWLCYSTLSAWQTACGCDDNSAVTEVTDSMDTDGFHLKDSFEGAIGEGKNISAEPGGAYEGVDYDIDDPTDTRPQGSDFDIGCDEVTIIENTEATRRRRIKQLLGF